MKRLITFALISLLVSPTLAQMNKENSNSAPLQYRIGLKKIDKKRQAVILQLKITNNSNNIVVIDKKALAYEVLFTRRGKQFRDGGVGPEVGYGITNDPSEGYRGDYILLRPGRYFTEKRAFSLNGDFFEDGNTFTISLVYGVFLDGLAEGIKIWRGTVTSNKIDFHL